MKRLIVLLPLLALMLAAPARAVGLDAEQYLSLIHISEPTRP